MVRNPFSNTKSGVAVEAVDDYKGAALSTDTPQGPNSARLPAELVEQLKHFGGSGCLPAAPRETPERRGTSARPRTRGGDQAAAAVNPRLFQIVDVGSSRFRA